MDICIIIPAYNEEDYLANTLQSLVNQTYKIKQIVVVNDNSSDSTQDIIESFTEKHSFIKGLATKSESIHLPGSKVINAFYKGLNLIDNDYEIICKLDADLIFPPNYFETIIEHFKNNTSCGMAGGFCYIKKKWSLGIRKLNQ